MLTACFSVMVQLLLLLIRIAMKLRLSIPLVYLVLMLTAFRPWYRVHATLADGIFLVMLGCVTLSQFCHGSSPSFDLQGEGWLDASPRFFALHGGRTWRLCGADLHGCAGNLQNRTCRHNAPHAAEQMAAPMSDS